MQKKWKSYRDCFIKYINNPSRTNRPYIYLQNLQFLLKDKRIANRKPVSSDSDDDKPISEKRRRTIKKEIDHESNDDMESDDADTSAKAGESEFAFANTDVAPSTSSEIDNSDKLFLMSLLPHLQTVPSRKKLDVKMELINVLRNANLPSTY